jgi:hypothetical protein
MKARTLGYVVAACAPFWLLALVAILGRSFYSPYNEVEIGREDTRKILAYVSPIQYNQKHQVEISKLEPIFLDQAANNWITLYELGSLQNIDPIDPSDDENRGFRSEIELNRRLILVSLYRDMESKLKANKFDDVANRASQILKIGEIAKYNGAQSSAFSSSIQSQVLTFMDSKRTNVSASVLEAYDKTVQQLKPNPEHIKQTALRLSAMTKSTVLNDEPVLPSLQEVKMMMTSSPNSYVLSDRVNSDGALLAESYRVAYQEEVRLEAHIQSYGLTASRTNLVEKSGLP